MELTNQSQIQIQNKIFTLGSPVTHADTLEQLLYVFQQQGIEGRPIVIINPVEDSLPDLANLLENYIENAMQGSYSNKVITSYMFQNATDEEIIAWAHSQYNAEGYQTVDSLIETGKAIRKQSQLKAELDRANARREELWKQHCINPNSDEGSAEYADLSYNVIPRIQESINQVTERMKSIPANLKTGNYEEPQPVNVENVETSVESTSVGVENPVESVETDLEMSGTGTPDIMLMKSTRLMMPLSVAKQLAQNPQNSVFAQQQSIKVPGYVTVPVEYLIALGVPLYADGVPIVYTKSGKFRRMGKSDISPVANAYWYPKPRYT